MTLRARHVLAAGLLALGCAGPATAQPVIYYAPEAPTVLQTDRAGRVIVPPTRPDLAMPPVPVPQVMNGGGFGLTGFDYYNDEFSESRFGARKHPKVFVLAPAPIDPAWRY